MKQPMFTEYPGEIRTRLAEREFDDRKKYKHVFDEYYRETGIRVSSMQQLRRSMRKTDPKPKYQRDYDRHQPQIRKR